jgi:ribosomal protein L40E
MNHKICPNCGARNAEGALWCGQCYTSFTEDTSEAAPRPAVQPGEPQLTIPLQPAKPGVPSGAKWICPTCDTSNPVELSACAACGTSIFAAYTTPEQADPKQALVRGLLVPGLGHHAARQGLLGAAIGLLVVVTILFGVMLISTGARGPGWGLVLFGVAVWLVGALDAFRIARDETEDVLLRPRVVSVLAGIVVLVLIGVSISAQGKVQP